MQEADAQPIRVHTDLQSPSGWRLPVSPAVAAGAMARGGPVAPEKGFFAFGDSIDVTGDTFRDESAFSSVDVTGDQSRLPASISAQSCRVTASTNFRRNPDEHEFPIEYPLP